MSDFSPQNGRRDCYALSMLSERSGGYELPEVTLKCGFRLRRAAAEHSTEVDAASAELACHGSRRSEGELRMNYREPALEPDGSRGVSHRPRKKAHFQAFASGEGLEPTTCCMAVCGVDPRVTRDHRTQNGFDRLRVGDCAPGWRVGWATTKDLPLYGWDRDQGWAVRPPQDRQPDVDFAPVSGSRMTIEPSLVGGCDEVGARLARCRHMIGQRRDRDRLLCRPAGVFALPAISATRPRLGPNDACVSVVAQGRPSRRHLRVVDVSRIGEAVADRLRRLRQPALCYRSHSSAPCRC